MKKKIFVTIGIGIIMGGTWLMGYLTGKWSEEVKEANNRITDKLTR